MKLLVFFSKVLLDCHFYVNFKEVYQQELK